MPDVIYNSFVKAHALQDVSLLHNKVMGLLVTDNYTPDRKAHSVRAHLGDCEVAGINYQSGGLELTGRSITDDTDGDPAFAAAALVWPDSTISAAGLVLYIRDESNDDATQDRLVCYFGFGATKKSDHGRFMVEWPDGIVMSLVIKE